MNRLRAGWNWLWFRPAAPYALAASRIVIAYCSLVLLFGRVPQTPGLPILNWRNLWPVDFSGAFATYAENSPATYAPTSFLDLFGVPPPTQTALTVVFAVAVVSAWMLLFGMASRITSVTTAVSLLYLIAMMNSWGKVNHAYHVLGIALLLLSFSRSGDAWSIDAVVRRRLPVLLQAGTGPSWQYRWPVVAIQLGYALMFFFAGWNKLKTSGLEWAFSENMRNTLVYQNAFVRDWDTASWLVRTAVEVDQAWVWYSLGAGALLTELVFVGIVFVSHCTWIRRALLLVGVGLVAGLDLMMQLPNPVLLAMLLLFVDWNGLQRRASEALSGLRSIRATGGAGIGTAG